MSDAAEAIEAARRAFAEAQGTSDEPAARAKLKAAIEAAKVPPDHDGISYVRMGGVGIVPVIREPAGDNEPVSFTSALREALGEWAGHYEDQRTKSQPSECARIKELSRLLVEPRYLVNVISNATLLEALRGSILTTIKVALEMKGTEVFTRADLEQFADIAARCATQTLSALEVKP